MQTIGGPGAAKRIDTTAAALCGEMTLDDLADLNLAYAPPFATVWEAVQLPAGRLVGGWAAAKLSRWSRA